MCVCHVCGCRVCELRLPTGKRVRLMAAPLLLSSWPACFLHAPLPCPPSFIYAAVYWGEGRVPNPAEMANVQNGGAVVGYRTVAGMPVAVLWLTSMDSNRQPGGHVASCMLRRLRETPSHRRLAH